MPQVRPRSQINVFTVQNVHVVHLSRCHEKNVKKFDS